MRAPARNETGNPEAAGRAWLVRAAIPHSATQGAEWPHCIPIGDYGAISRSSVGVSSPRSAPPGHGSVADRGSAGHSEEIQGASDHEVEAPLAGCQRSVITT